MHCLDNVHTAISINCHFYFHFCSYYCLANSSHTSTTHTSHTTHSPHFQLPTIFTSSTPSPPTPSPPTPSLHFFPSSSRPRPPIPTPPTRPRHTLPSPTTTATKPHPSSPPLRRWGGLGGGAARGPPSLPARIPVALRTPPRVAALHPAAPQLSRLPPPSPYGPVE